MNVDITPTDGFPHMYDYVNNAMGAGSNPLVLIILTFVIVSYYILFSYLGISGQAAQPVSQSAGKGISIIEIIMWGLFIFLILVNGLQYFFNINIKTGIKNLFSPIPEVDITVTTPGDVSIQPGSEPIPEITSSHQVFHIPENTYDYNSANALCKAYGGRLANISEIQSAYKDGAEWCGYGWSEGQMALYPTQEETWKDFQKIKGHEHDCGRPGINGGYIGNPNANFGVNCYGYKPKITKFEMKLMDKALLYPLTPVEKELEKRVKDYRRKLPDILVSPFNYDNWSQI